MMNIITLEYFLGKAGCTQESLVFKVKGQNVESQIIETYKTLKFSFVVEYETNFMFI